MTMIVDDNEESRVDLAGKSVVVCEDEGLSVMQFSTALIRAGLKIVGTAVNGVEAVSVVLEQRPDFVFMDINMPMLSGIEATRAILSVFQTKIIVVTAYGDHEHLDDALSAGAVGYLVKPIASQDILDALNDIAGAEANSQQQF